MSRMSRLDSIVSKLPEAECVRTSYTLVAPGSLSRLVPTDHGLW
jgi:hypothetical protein